MPDDNKILAESLSAEAVQIAAVHAEATQKANAANMHVAIISALKEVLSDESGSPLLIKRIPFICTDITKIKSDIGWLKWLIMGMCGGMGYVVVELITHSLK